MDNIYKYKCFNCNNFETESYNSMRKHLFKRILCKKNKIENMSTDHVFVNSILPYTSNDSLINIAYLENSEILYDNKKELFEELDKIYNENITTCSICNKQLETKYELQKHITITEINDIKDMEETKKGDMKDLQDIYTYGVLFLYELIE